MLQHFELVVAGENLKHLTATLRPSYMVCLASRGLFTLWQRQSSGRRERKALIGSVILGWLVVGIDRAAGLRETSEHAKRAGRTSVRLAR